jgi:hypothetical protein
MLSRPLSAFEKWFFDTNEVVQYAVTLATARHADEFIDFLTKSVSACHLRSDGESVIHDATPLPVTKLPSSLRTARDAAIWAGTSNLPTYSNRLASIAARDNLVVLSTCHSFTDGVSLLHLTNDFLHGKVAEPTSTLPIPLEARFQDELSGPIDVSRHLADVGKRSSIPWSEKVDAKLPEDVRCDYQFVELPASAFQCFDREKNRVAGFNDALWRSIMLACAAVSPLEPSFGTITCVNARPFLKSRSEKTGNIFVPLCVAADGVTKDTKVGELDRRLRRDFATKIETKEYLASFKASLNGYGTARKKASFADVSNIGIFELAHPIEDVWAQQTMKSRTVEGLVASLSYGIKSKDQNKIVVRLQTSPSVIDRRDASRVFQSFLHSLQHVQPNVTVGDAIREIRQTLKL